MRERNRSGRGARRRSGGDEGADLFAKQLSEIVQQAFAPATDAKISAAQPDQLNLSGQPGQRTNQTAPESTDRLAAPPEEDAKVVPNVARDAEPLPARMLNEFVYCPRLFYYEHVEGVFMDNADTLRGSAVHSRVDKGSGAMPPPGARKAETSSDKDEASISKANAEPETIHSRSVTLGSERLGVIAKLDLVEMRQEGAITSATPGGLPPSEACAPPATEIGTISTKPGSGTGHARESAELLSRLHVCPVDYKAGAPRESEEGNELWPTDRMQLGLQMLLLRENGYRCERGIIYYRATKQRVALEFSAELEAWLGEQIGAARQTMRGPIPPPLVGSPKCVRCSLNSVCLPDETRLLAEPPKVDFEHGRSAVSLPPRVAPRRLMTPRDDTRVLYLNKPGLRVGRKDELLVVKEEDKKLEEIRIGDLTHVALFGNVQISTQAVQVLCEREVPLTYFSMGGWFYGITRGHELKNVFTRMEQFRLARDPPVCLALARAMVNGKVRNHRTMLMRLHLEPPAPVVAKLKTMADSALRAESLDELLGTEGAAAHFYFSAFAGMLKAEDEFVAGDPAPGPQLRFNFAGRNRRPPTDPVNALLSLAYSLLAKDCTLAAMAVGLDPYVGFYHQPRFGRPALALDVMEEFRPLIAESAVLTAINNRMILPKHFVRAGEAVNLSSAGRKMFFQVYEQRMSALITHPIFEYKVSYRRVLELQFRLLARFLTEEIPEYLPFVTR